MKQSSAFLENENFNLKNLKHETEKPGMDKTKDKK